ncbi:galectin [Peziza echinospora]|nr:galectin [Peziza echinospora]
MAATFYILCLGSTIPIKPEFKKDNLIYFNSATLDLNPTKTGTNTIDNSAVNLISSKNDTLLHISIRRTENAVVFNTKPNNAGWGTEERIVLKGTFTKGNNATITVYDHGDRYQILFDGKTVHYYKKRIEDNATQVSYTINKDVAQVFSRELGVTTFPSLPTWVGA